MFSIPYENWLRAIATVPAFIFSLIGLLILAEKDASKKPRSLVAATLTLTAAAVFFAIAVGYLTTSFWLGIALALVLIVLAFVRPEI